MGLDTFPFLQNHVCLITYNNTVFKLKLEYQEISQQKREAFAGAVSERAAHCQIEDVCRALLYNIEREEELSPIQTDHFIIYPEVSKWPVSKKVQFTVNGKHLSCHQDLILLKLICKDVAVSGHEKTQVSVSSSEKRKSSSCRLSHDLEVRAGSSNQSKTTSALCLENPHTDNSNAETATVSCANNNARMLDTPILGTDNIRGGLSLKSNNKITTLMQKHCSMTQKSTKAVQSNCSGFTQNQHTENRVIAETHGDRVIPDKSKHQRTKEPGQKNDLPKLVRDKKQQQGHLLNIEKTKNMWADSESSENDSSLNTDHGNKNLRKSAQQARKAINSMMENVQPGVPWNEISDVDSNIRLSDSRDLQTGRDIPVSTVTRIQSIRDNQLCKSKCTNRMITRSESQKRGYLHNAFMHKGIRQHERKYLAYQSKRIKRISKAHGSMIKNLTNVLTSKGGAVAARKRYKHQSNSTNISSNSREGAEPENSVLFKEIRKYPSTLDETKLRSNSLEMSDNDIVEISDDGSIIYESERINNIEGIPSISPSVTVRCQNAKRKSSCSSEYDNDQQQKFRYSGRSPESDDVGTSKEMNNTERGANQNNNGSCGTPAKIRGRPRKTHVVWSPDGSDSRSEKIHFIRVQQQKVGTNLERYTNQTEGSSDGSFLSTGPQTRNKRKEQKDSELPYGCEITNINISSAAGHTRRISSKERQTLICDAEHRERAFSETPKVSTSSNRNSKAYYTHNERTATKGSDNHSVNLRNKVVDVRAKEKVAVDTCRKIPHNLSDRGNSDPSDSSRRAVRSLSENSSLLETKRSSRTLLSGRTSVSHSPKLSSKPAGHILDTSEAERKLHEAQQHLLESKDGVWLFWKSSRRSDH